MEKKEGKKNRNQTGERGTTPFYTFVPWGDEKRKEEDWVKGEKHGRVTRLEWVVMILRGQKGLLREERGVLALNRRRGKGSEKGPWLKQ